MHPTLPFRPDLQGLRSLAILLVVLSHSGVSAFSGGFVGVDVFFVLSGYLITGLLLREYAETSRIDFAAFIARRLRRLLPALATMLSVVFVFAYIELLAFEASQQTRSLPFAISWTSNLFFAFTTFDYFADQPSRDLFLHTWSLGVEEQFYLLWPLLLLAVLTFLRRRKMARRPWLAIALGSAFALSLALELYWMKVNTLWAFYLMPARIWQFALGALTFVWLDSVNSRTERRWYETAPVFRQTAGLVGIAGILASAMLLTADSAYPGLFAMAPSIAAALVIIGGQNAPGSLPQALLASRPAVWLGDRSYSWYLWHWPVLVLGSVWPERPGAAGTSLLVALSLLLAAASFRWIERPIWKGRVSRTRPRHAFVGAVLAMLVVVFGAPWIAEQAFRYDAPQEASLPAELRVTVPEVYRHDCDSWTASAALVPCVFGNPGADRTVLLLGDSIGAQWYGLLPELFDTENWRIVVLTKSACPMVDEDFFYERIGSIYTVCTEWRDAMLEYVADSAPDVVFVGSSAYYPFTADEWKTGSRRVVEALSRSAGSVVVIPGTPMLSFDGQACLRRAAGKSVSPQICSEFIDAPQSAVVADYLAEAISGLDNVHLLDLADLVCPENICSAVAASGLAVFRDHVHLSDRYVRAQAGPVETRLAQMGVRPDAQAYSAGN